MSRLSSPVRVTERGPRAMAIPQWPAEFAYSTTVPLDRSPAAHTDAGQRAAIHALARAGCSIAELPPRTGRRPAWPAGFTGSIAHDDALAIAVVARSDAATCLGIDVERYDALSVRDARVVLHDDELDFADDDPALATLIWSAKESAYKAWCTGVDVDLERVDPRDIRIAVPRADTFHARATGALADRVASIGALHGRWMRVDALVITLAWRVGGPKG